MSRLKFSSVAAIFAFCPVAVSFGHHSFSAEFDRDKPIKVTGTVTRVEWTNPHARIYLDVQDAEGKVVNWDFELGPPNGLMRQGWRRDSLREGHVVTINGFRSKDQEHVANARSVHLPDGRQVLAGSSFDIDSANAAQ
jgi:hypothetical protein